MGALVFSRLVQGFKDCAVEPAGAKACSGVFRHWFPALFHQLPQCFMHVTHQIDTFGFGQIQTFAKVDYRTENGRAFDPSVHLSFVACPA
ncbi:MAG TPA: hypothetical protein VGO11_06905 [Chthoniobacteraceae bacterium]|nr:hypothetical protein [Chthoniobacteraceae bacterium]